MSGIKVRVRAMLAPSVTSAVRNAHRCAIEAIALENVGAHKSYDCAHWWLGAVLCDFGARLLGYAGPSLEAQLGRPPRPMPTHPAR